MNRIAQIVRPLPLLLLGSFVGACDAPDDLGDGIVDDELLDDEDVEFRISTLTTGRRLNTNHGGPHVFSEVNIYGDVHEDTRLDHIDYLVDPADPNSPVIPVITSTLQVWGGELYAIRDDGYWVWGSEWNQTRWFIEAFEPSGPSTYELMVESGYDYVYGTGTPLYTFYYLDHYGEGWLPTCPMASEWPEIELTAAVYGGLEVDEDDSDGLTGDMTVDNDLIYIGCTSGAVGKASLWGYRPDYGTFASHYSADPVGAFEAAVRMLRADYCGNGVSWTLPGTEVALRDKAGVNDSISGFLPGQGPQSEAVWDENGAMCLDAPRVPPPFGAPVSCNGVPINPCWFGADNWYADPSAMFQTGF